MYNAEYDAEDNAVYNAEYDAEYNAVSIVYTLMELSGWAVRECSVLGFDEIVSSK